MLEEISFEKFLEWMEFDAMHPIGEVRGDWQAASISSSLANVLAAIHGVKQRFKPSDFVLTWKDPDDPEQKPVEDAGETSEAKVARFKFIGQMMAAAANADEERKAKRKRK